VKKGVFLRNYVDFKKRKAVKNGQNSLKNKMQGGNYE